MTRTYDEPEDNRQVIGGWSWCIVHNDMSDDGTEECETARVMGTEDECKLVDLFIEKPETVIVEVLFNGNHIGLGKQEMKPDDTLSIAVNQEVRVGLINDVTTGKLTLGYFEGEEWIKLKEF